MYLDSMSHRDDFETSVRSVRVSWDTASSRRSAAERMNVLCEVDRDLCHRIERARHYACLPILIVVRDVIE